jgi:hypothetical protein
VSSLRCIKDSLENKKNQRVNAGSVGLADLQQRIHLSAKHNPCARRQANKL